MYGWQPSCEWKDSHPFIWQNLSGVKDSHSLQVTEFTFLVHISIEAGLIGGWAGSSRRETTSKVLNNTSIPISMGSNSLQLLRTLALSAKPLVQPFCMMQLKRRWKMCALPLASLGTVSCHHQIIIAWVVTWSLISIWRIFYMIPAWSWGTHSKSSGNTHLCMFSIPSNCAFLPCW